MQIRQNSAGATLLASYIVGRHRDKPNVIVIDPRVDAGNPLGLPANAGFKANQVYVYIIPPGNGFSFEGHIAQPAGPAINALPIIIPPSRRSRRSARSSARGLSFGPDPVPPAIVSIAPMSGHTGTALDPMLPADPIVVTFSKQVTAASLDPIKNFIVRNIDQTNSTYPQGILVPGSIEPVTPGATAASQFRFIPASPYGPGVSPTEGFDIEVRIGDIPYPQPNSVVPPILGLPTGLSGTQLELSNSLNKILRATPCTGCQTPASVVEGFDNTTHLDPTFVPVFGPARWNAPSAPSQLAGRAISGSPTANTWPDSGPRFQIPFTPLPLNTSPAGLFSPFDASAANSGNQCGAGGCNLGTQPERRLAHHAPLRGRGPSEHQGLARADRVEPRSTQSRPRPRTRSTGSGAA